MEPENKMQEQVPAETASRVERQQAVDDDNMDPAVGSKTFLFCSFSFLFG